MTREQAKELLPIIKAFSEGKTIQTKIKTDSKALYEKWIDVRNPDLYLPGCYRIKTEPKYRPFKNAEECWQEMLKHQPFGWAKLIGENEYSIMTDVNDNIQFEEAMKEYTFADGTPFGIQVKEADD